MVLGLRVRDESGHTETAALFRTCGQGTIVEGDPLAHSPQAVAAPADGGSAAAPRPSSTMSSCRPRACQRKRDTSHCFGAGVLHDVGEGFLNDAVGREFGAGGKRPAGRSDLFKGDLESGRAEAEQEFIQVRQPAVAGG